MINLRRKNADSKEKYRFTLSVELEPSLLALEEIKRAKGSRHNWKMDNFT